MEGIVRPQRLKVRTFFVRSWWAGTVKLRMIRQGCLSDELHRREPSMSTTSGEDMDGSRRWGMRVMSEEGVHNARLS